MKVRSVGKIINDCSGPRFSALMHGQTAMKETYLEVTYRAGAPLAAYLYLPRKDGDHSVRVEKRGAGLIVDLSDDGRPIGIEIAIPALVTVEAVNEVLASYGLAPIDPAELAPLKAAA